MITAERAQLAGYYKAAHYVMAILAVIAPAKAERYAEDPNCRRYAYTARTIRAWVVDDHTIALTASGDQRIADAVCTAVVDAAYCALAGSTYDMPLEQGHISEWLPSGMMTFTW